MNDPLKVGIYAPDFLLVRHNTDFAMIRSFERLAEREPVSFRRIASWQHTLAANVNRVAQRCFHRRTEIAWHVLRPTAQDAQVIYHYGRPVAPGKFFQAVAGRSTVVTTGFMTDRYVARADGSIPDRQAEADRLARDLERADRIHFHTEGGRRRFLDYRPDFAEKTVAIPFFLPDLEVRGGSERGEEIRLLFVGYEGQRKGIDDLMSALGVLGVRYLNEWRVSVTVISRDRPRPPEGLRFAWKARIPHRDVLAEMRQASIFVLVPRRESYGLVLLEAMAAGCAVVTDDDAPRTEILGSSGRQVPPRRPDLLASTLRELIEDREERVRLGENAVSRVRRIFSPEVVGSQYARLLANTAALEPQG